MIERNELIHALKKYFDADCDISVRLPDGRVTPVIAITQGANVSEDAVLITEGADIMWRGEGAIVSCKL